MTCQHYRISRNQRTLSWRTLVFYNNCGPAIVWSHYTRLMKTVSRTWMGYSSPGVVAERLVIERLGMPASEASWFVPAWLVEAPKGPSCWWHSKGLWSIYTHGRKVSMTNRLSIFPVTVHTLGSLIFWINKIYSTIGPCYTCILHLWIQPVTHLEIDIFFLNLVCIEACPPTPAMIPWPIWSKNHLHGSHIGLQTVSYPREDVMCKRASVGSI